MNTLQKLTCIVTCIVSSLIVLAARDRLEKLFNNRIISNNSNLCVVIFARWKSFSLFKTQIHRLRTTHHDTAAVCARVAGGGIGVLRREDGDRLFIKC